jgi:hypothetical protein
VIAENQRRFREASDGVDSMRLDQHYRADISQSRVKWIGVIENLDRIGIDIENGRHEMSTRRRDYAHSHLQDQLAGTPITGHPEVSMIPKRAGAAVPPLGD